MKKYRIKSVTDKEVVRYTPQMRYLVLFWMNLEMNNGKGKLSEGHAHPVNSREEALRIIESYKVEAENRKKKTRKYEYIG